MTIEEINYALEQLELQHVVPWYKITVMNHDDLDALVFRLKRMIAVWKPPSGGRLTIKYPSSWWQHFKEEVFPRWLLRKYPVEYNTDTYQARAYLPGIPVPPDSKSRIVYHDFKRIEE